MACEWITLDSDMLYDHCGDSWFDWTLAEALDGIDHWNHDINHTHWFIIDLGQEYNISKIASYSDTGYDPIDVDIYISNNPSSFTNKIIDNITDWQDHHTSYIEHSTDSGEWETGRYLKFYIYSTEDGSNRLIWGDDPMAGAILKVLVCSSTTQQTNSSITLQGSTTQTVNTSINILDADHFITTPTSITITGTNTLDTTSSLTLQTPTNTLEVSSSIHIYDTPLYEHCGNENDLVIGCNFDGQIKYARVYNECLTSDQVKRNSQGNINYNDIVAWWDMTEGTGTTLYNKKDSTILSATTNATWAWTTNQLHASSWNITRCRGNTFDNATITISPVYMDYKTGDEIQLYNDTTGTTIWSGFLQHRGRISSDGLVTLEAIGLGSDIAYKKVTLDLTSKSPEYILTQALAQVAGSKGRTYTLSTPVPSGITIANYSIDDTLNRVIGEMIDRTGYTLRWTPSYTVYFEPTGNSSSGDTVDSSTIGTIFEEWIQDNPESLINKVNVDGEGLVDGDWENYTGDYSHDASIAMYGEHYLHVKVDYLSSDEEAGDLAEMLIRVNPTPGGSVVLPFSHLDWSDICNKTVTLIDELRQINGTYTVYSQTFNSDGTTRLTVGRDPETHWIDRARERNAIGAERARLLGSTSGTQYGNVSGNTDGYSLGGGASTSGYSLGGGASTSGYNLGAGADTSDETLGGTGQVNSGGSGHNHTIALGGLWYNHGHGVWNETSSGPLGDSGDPCPYHYHNVNITVSPTSSSELLLKDADPYCQYSSEGTHPHTSHSITPSPASHDHPATAWVSPSSHNHPADAWVTPSSHDHPADAWVTPSSHPHTIDIEEGVELDVTVTDLTRKDR